MKTAPKLGLYGLVLILALGGGAAAGAWVGPIDTSNDTAPHATEVERDTGHSDDADGH